MNPRETPRPDQRPRRALLAALSLVALALAVLVPAGPVADADAATPGLRVMTYNIKGNVAQREGDWHPQVVANAIAATGADVIGIQEVCNWQLADLENRLASQGWTYSSHVTTVTGPTVCGGPAMNGEYGIGMLSKLPLEDLATRSLPEYNEPRAVMSVTVRTGGVPVRLFNAHASPGAGIIHTSAIAEETARHDETRKVLTADLNVVHTSTAALAPFTDLSFREVDHLNRPTYSATLPTSKIDYVFVSGPVAIGETQVPRPPLAASDHLPLWSQLAFGDDPGEDPGEGLITFDSDRSGNRDIYVMAPDGSEVTRLTSHPATDRNPAFSPDGRRIAFESNRDGDWEIYLMNSDGTGLIRLTNRPGDDMDPAFSPDGARLAIRRGHSGTNDVFLIDSDDGGNPVNLTNSLHSDFTPSFSPDGSKIAFQRFQAGGPGNNVMIMNLDGSGQTNLTAGFGQNAGQPDFSPDGSRILFRSRTSSTQPFDLFTMAPDGTGKVRRSTSPRNEEFPAWGPDSVRVVFTRSVAHGQPAPGGFPNIFTAEIDPLGSGTLFPGSIVNRTLSPAGVTDANPDWIEVEPEQFPPASLGAASVDGVALVGRKLTCESGGWVGASRVGVVWTADGEQIDNAGPGGSQRRAFVPTEDVVGAEIACYEVGVNAYGRTDSEVSEPVVIGDSVPVIDTAPLLTTSNATGNQVVDEWQLGWQLRCEYGSYSNPTGNPWIGVSTEWASDGVGFPNVAPSGNTRMSYVSVPDDLGSEITCTQTATNIFGSTLAVSNGTTIIDG